MGLGVEFRILGPLEAVVAGRAVPLGGAQQRALLAVLVVRRGEVVAIDRLVDELWGERPPRTAAKTVQGYVAALRKVLSSDVIVTRGRGYVLDVEPDQVDAGRFESLLADAQRASAGSDPNVTRERLRAALGLWRGEPLTELACDGLVRIEVARLQELRLAAIGDQIDAELALGQHEAVVGQLEALVREHPLSERFRAQLMLALYRSGRQADALRAYRDARRVLVDELGIEPGPALRDLERGILSHDPALDAPPRAPTPARRSRRVPRGGILVGVGAALLLVVAALVSLRLADAGGSEVRVQPNSVAAIDIHSNRVVAAVPVGSEPGAIAFGSGSLWVANVGDKNVSRIDPAAPRTVHVLNLGETPTGIAASNNGIWVVEATPRSSSVAVRRIDPQFDTPEPERRLGNVVGGSPGWIAAQGNAVWVAPSYGLLARFDAASGRLIKQQDPNASPAGIAVGDGAVWVTDGDANNVTRIDPTGLRTPIPVGNGPSAIATGARGVWVTDTLDDAVVRIDPASNAVTNTIHVGRSPEAIAVADGSVWVANARDGTVTRIDPSTNKVAASITVGGSPHAITVAGARAWVTIGPPSTDRDLAPSGGSLRMETLQNVPNIDPALAYAGGSWQLLYATCAKLLNYPDRTGPAGNQLTPEIANALPMVARDRKAYTFTIRPGFRFSPPSNQPVTAQTFKTTIERTLNPRMQSPIAYEFADVVGAAAYMAGKTRHISGIQAHGDKLTIRLSSPVPDLPSRLAQPFFCAVPTNTPVTPDGVGAVPSAGPYYVASYTPNRSVVLVRNPNYHGRRPHRLDRIELSLGISSQKAVTHIQAGRADYTSIGGTPASTVSALAARLDARYGPRSPAAAHHRQQYFEQLLPGLNFLILNTHRPLFSDRRLRQAVNYAVDRRSLARLGGGYGSADHPASQYLPPGIPGYSHAPAYPLTPDLAKARALATGHGRTAILYTCNYAACLQLAQLVKDDLAAIGLRVEVKAFDHAALVNRIPRPHEPFDLAFYGWLPDWPDPASMLNGMFADPPALPTFDDPNYKREAAAAGRLTGPQRYLAFNKLALRLARDSAPIVPYGFAVNEEFFSPRIGCQTYGVYLYADLAALCIRRQH
ncbi:MAG TPA: ABC transporter substrate-binding protein [Solirubrobacteraceae bacterium]|nr:ABC transporter substrate-binding protein [Solirubrobacteraceae bacterium]